MLSGRKRNIPAAMDGLEFYRLIVTCQRLVIPLQYLQSDATVNMGLGVVRLKNDGLIIACHRLLITLHCLQEIAAVKIRISIVRL